jgi:maleate isomerase
MKNLVPNVIFKNLSRRMLIGGASKTALALLAAPAIIGLPKEPARAASRRALVGAIKPTARVESDADIIKLLPPGIDLLPVGIGFRKGTKDEFKAGIPAYQKEVSYLAGQHCNLISAEGAPTFMILGPQKEASLTAEWERKYKTPVFTASQNQVHALHAVNAKNIFGATYFPENLNKIYAQYFIDSGFNVIRMDGLDLKRTSFNKIQDIPSSEVYSFIKNKFLKAKGADVIYILGSGWETLDIIDRLEQELQVPVIHPVAARAWEIQQRLNIKKPITGFGQLLAKLPACGC